MQLQLVSCEATDFPHCLTLNRKTNIIRLAITGEWKYLLLTRVFCLQGPRNEVILQRNMFGGTKRKALQIFYVSPPKKGSLG